jgi:8-oxo-dGTP diphosphatase
MSDPDEITEAEYLEQYRTRERPTYGRAEHTVDIALFTIRQGVFSLLLIRRGNHPYKGYWALPGGFVDVGDGESESGEGLDQAVYRELAEETGIKIFPGHLEQLRTYGDLGRDPRGRVFSTAYVALMPDIPSPAGGDDAAEAHFFPVADLGTDEGPALAFDHAAIIADAVERVRGKIEYEGRLAASFLTSPFTVPELRRVYEAVWGGPVHRSDFHRKVMSVKGFLVPTLTTKADTGGPEARLYRLGEGTTLHPPFQRHKMLLDKQGDRDS